jgi:acid phosphatase
LINPQLLFFFSSSSLAFDETGDDKIQNRVAGILLGNAIPKHLIGTTDSNFYNHYSEISTVEANWDLPTLGRRDVGANVFAFVAQETQDSIRSPVNPPLGDTFLNLSYPGPYNSVNTTSFPVPNTKLVVNGRKVLDSIVKMWGSPELQKCTPYTGSVEVPSGANPPVLPEGCV